MTHRIICGDSLHVLPTLDAESVDAIVCDPPYGLSFMGKEWDHGVPGEAFWREALRVAKPGAHLLAFGGSRTYHRLACAIEDAGWEIRDCLSWLYGSGFPKSMNVSKALEAHETLGGSHTVMMRKAAMGDDYVESEAKGTFRNGAEGAMNSVRTTPPEFNPTTDLARQWQGWGTALKPAWEPVIVARKPLVGTVASNVAQYGTGALNVDGCRIGTDVWTRKATGNSTPYGSETTWNTSKTPDIDRSGTGRWPANVCLDEEAAGMLDAQTGANVSRFLYTAKASRSEREAGLEGMPEVNPFDREGPSANFEKMGSKSSPRTNPHPTVKPIALMRWLCRLVTPPNGLVLDPFTGSGSTGCAAALEGFRFVGIEREPEYAEIARRRIAHWASQRGEPTLFDG